MVKVYLVEDEIINTPEYQEQYRLGKKRGMNLSVMPVMVNWQLPDDFEGEAGYSDHGYPYAVYGWTGVKPYG